MENAKAKTASPATGMSRAIIIVAAVAVAGVILVSAAFNLMFAATLGTTPQEKAGFITAALAIDALKATLLIFAGALIARRKIATAAVAVLLWCGCLAWSSASALGFASLSRGAAVAGRTVEVDARQAAEAKTRRIEAGLAAVSAHRPAAVIEAAILAAAGRDPVLWRQTRKCADATKPASADWCKPVLTLRGELASANEAARLEEALAEARGELASAGGATGGALAADPQGEALAALLGLPVADVRHSLGLLLAGLIEAISALGFAVTGAAWGQASAGRARIEQAAREPVTASAGEPLPLAAEPPPVSIPVSIPKALAAEPDAFAAWAAARLGKARRVSVSAAAALADFNAWCADHGLAPMNGNAFGRAMSGELSRLGGKRGLIEGRAIYRGVALGRQPGEHSEPIRAKANGHAGRATNGAAA